MDDFYFRLKFYPICLIVTFILVVIIRLFTLFLNYHTYKHLKDFFWDKTNFWEKLKGEIFTVIKATIVWSLIFFIAGITSGGGGGGDEEENCRGGRYGDC